MTAMAHLRFLLMLLWIGVTVSSVVDLHKRIIGGQDCRDDEHQHHVLLTNTFRTSFCGGSLLRNGWILTAAHCLQNIWHVDAYLTRNSLATPVRITEAHEFHKIRCHDLMLLKLPDTAVIPPGLRPIDLPDCSRKPNVGDTVRISGHASNMMNNGQRIPGFTPRLQCLGIEVTDCTQLRAQSTAENSHFNYQYWFCAQSPRVDICLGDSGGGVVYNGKIYGVIAFTGSKTHGCVEPAGFMDLCHKDYYEWIKKTTQSRPCLNCLG